jgi:hypothetical protein
MGAYLVWSRTKMAVPVYVYGAVAIGLLGAATAAFFSGPILAIIYTLEVTALVILAGRIIETPAATQRMAILYALPLTLSLEHIISSAWETGFMHQHCAVLAVVTTSLFVAGASLLQLASEGKRMIGIVLVVIGSAYGLGLLWLISHAVLPDDVATMLSLFVYTVLGLGLYIKGVSADSKNVKIFGGSLIGLVVLRLLVVDVWHMALTGRIITFFVIGILLISTAFIGKLNSEK